MDVPRGYYAEWDKSNTERQLPYGLTYMWNLNKQTKTHQTHRKKKKRVDLWLPEVGAMKRGSRGRES